MNRILFHFVSKFIHESGVEMFKTRQPSTYDKTWRFFAILVLYVTIGTSTILQSLLKDDGIDKFINPVPYAALGSVVTSHSLIIFVYRDTLSEMLRQMDAHVYTYPDESRLLVHYKWYLSEENIIIAMKVVLYWQVMNLGGLCTPGIIELYRYNKIETFIYPGWTPWKVDTIAAQVVTFVWQFFPPLCGICLNQIVIMMIYLVLFEFLRQYERLKVAIESLKYRTEVATGSNTKEKNRTKYDAQMERNIIHCIKHLQKLHENFHSFKTWFSTILSWELAIATLTLSIGIYAMINAPSWSTLLRYCIVIAYMMINLLVKCLIGDVFVGLNNNVAYALYSQLGSEWFELNKINRQLIVIFHSMTCQNFHLFGFQIFEVTRALYGRIIRITYSVFNVLNISLNK